MDASNVDRGNRKWVTAKVGPIFTEICHMNGFPGLGGAGHGGVGVRAEQLPLSPLLLKHHGQITVERSNAEGVTFAQKHPAITGFTKPRRVREHDLEHRLQLAGRARDDLQHLRGRGLLLQRLGELAGPRLHLVEQPHVLDRDHRLIGEGCGEADLLVGERLDHGPLQE